MLSFLTCFSRLWQVFTVFTLEMLPTTVALSEPFKSHHKSFAYRSGNDRNYFFANEKMTGDTGACGMILTILAYALCLITLPLSAFLCVKIVQVQFNITIHKKRRFAQIFYFVFWWNKSIFSGIWKVLSNFVTVDFVTSMSKSVKCFKRPFINLFKTMKSFFELNSHFLQKRSDFKGYCFQTTIVCVEVAFLFWKYCIIKSFHIFQNKFIDINLAKFISPIQSRYFSTRTIGSR